MTKIGVYPLSETQKGYALKLKGIVAAAGIAVALSGGVLVGFANADTASVTPAPTTTVSTTPIAVTPAPTARTLPPIARTTTLAPRPGREIAVLPNGAPETGGGGMSYLVSTWG